MEKTLLPLSELDAQVAVELPARETLATVNQLGNSLVAVGAAVDVSNVLNNAQILNNTLDNNNVCVAVLGTC